MSLDPLTVHARLKSTGRQFRLSRGIRWFVSGAAVSMLLLFFFLIGDTCFHFGTAERWIACGMTLSPIIAGILLGLPSLFQKMSDEAIARRIERSCSGSGNVLINAVQFDRALANVSPLRNALFEEMRDPFPRVSWSELFDLGLLKKLFLGLGGVGLILTGWALIQPAIFTNSAERILLPASNIAPLTQTRLLEIKPGNTKVPRGGTITLSAKVGGKLPETAWVHFREQGGGWQKELMDHDTGSPEFLYTWKDVRQPTEYFIELGDAVTETFFLTVRPRTMIRERSVEIQPPAYTHLPRSQLKNFNSIPGVVPGSQIRVLAEFNNPVKGVKIFGEKETPFEVLRSDATHWEFHGVISVSQPLTIQYTDEEEMTDKEVIQVTVKPDEPPKIRILAPSEGKEVAASRDASLPIQCDVTDDYGLGSVVLYKSTNDKLDAEPVFEWKDANSKKSFQAGTKISLRSFSKEEDERVTFCVIAKDQNNVSGPGTAISHPIVVRLQSAEKLAQQSVKSRGQLQQGIEELISLQQMNLDATRAVVASRSESNSAIPPLLDREFSIAGMAAKLVDSQDAISPELRADLRSMGEKEFRQAVLALRNARATSGEVSLQSTALAADLEAVILARLKGAPSALGENSLKDQIKELIGGVEELLRRQREILGQTGKTAKEGAKDLAAQQDSLADQSERIRKETEKNAGNASLGDKDFRDRLMKASIMLTNLHVYPDMLASAEMLEAGKFPEGTIQEKKIVANLAQIVEFLNRWQLTDAAKNAEALGKAASEMKEKLARLEEIQHAIVEKSKELEHKDQFRPEDQAAAKEIQKSKDLMAAAVEQMLTDAHVFPEMKPSNELRSELSQIYEDVIQSDKQDAAEGKLKPTEIAVQKEDWILKGIEEAKKISEDMEMWLPNKNDTTKWELENFDKTEMPEIPNLPLPDAFEDIVGKLLEEQQGLAEQVQDAASNQAFAQNPGNGWGIADGPQPGFGAHGNSGNTRPKKNEQTGRASGGREGMSEGEMVGDRASNLEGTKPDVRRTSDPMQQGHVKDDGGVSSTRATGGGKAGGYSDRNGMDGNAPLRSVNAPAMLAQDALAVKQALLAEKTSRKYAEASLLYLRSNGLTEVSRLMDESTVALKEGRLNDFKRIHSQIIGELHAARGDIQAGGTIVLPTHGAPQDESKQLIGGDEGTAPEAYKSRLPTTIGR